MTTDCDPPRPFLRPPRNPQEAAVYTKLIGDIRYLRAQYDSIVEMLHAAQAERDALRTALETYGRHRAGCRATYPMMAGREYLCACGLDDLVMRRPSV